ncbi:hypothetical protein [Streptomyces sp. NPDC007083]|uniref:hypothetical protein n=1 Tax=Streptomyces sp. NPDC007083 TaxID=3156913 RepID=UPI00340EE56E
MNVSPSITALPPADLLPESVRPLLEDRDAAYDRWSDFDAEHAPLLSESWEAAYEARDIVAAAEAVAAGKDPMKVKSALVDARDRRPRVIGAFRELVKAVNVADRALVQEYRKHVNALAPVAAAGLQSTAKAYEDAHRALLEARAAFGRATAFRRYVRAWQGSGSPDFSDSGSVPTLASGMAPNAEPGLAEVREVMDSFRAAGLSDDASADAPADRLVKIRFGDSQEMELAYSQARALVGSANVPGVEWADPADAPAASGAVDQEATRA